MGRASDAARRLRWERDAALDLLALPVALFLLLALADAVAGQDPQSAQHLVQGAPFALVVLLAWRFPHAMGTLLVMFGLAAAAAYLATIALWWPAAIASAVIAFMPPVVAGSLLITASRR